MEKKIFILIVVLAGSVLAYSQQTVLKPQVIATAGNSGTAGNYHLSYTIGQVVAGTGTANNSIYTQGFHQPGACMPPPPSICTVTVDSLSNFNIIVWDKTSYHTGDTFIVYRDTANYNYALIGKVPYDSLSQFIDTVRTLYAANGDPNASSWRYKLAVMDTCGNISAMSPYHQSIFNQNNSGNFNWSQYQIEGQSLPVPALSNYLFQRDNLSNGNWTTIATLSASSTLFTDPNYSTYQSTAKWRVQTQWSITCTATLQKLKTYNASKSNTAVTSIITAVATMQQQGGEVVIFPNPTANSITIFYSLPKPTNVTLEITNIIGKKIATLADSEKQIQGEHTFKYKFSEPGVYFIFLKTEEGMLVRKQISL